MADFKKSLMNKKGAGLRPFVINIILVVVFSVFIIYFALGFISMKNPNSSILTQSNLNGSLNALNQSLSDFTTQAGNVYNTMGSSQPTATDFLFLIFKGAFDIPFSFLKFGFSGIGNIFNIIFVSFGGGMFGSIVTILLGLVTSILTVTLVLYIVKTIRTGDSDH